MNKCEISGCPYSDKHLRRGLCQPHYKGFRQNNKLIKDKERKEPRPAIILGEIAKIPLGINAKFGYTIVDRNFAYLADEHKFSLSSTGYAHTSMAKHIKLHHLIIGKPPKDHVVDHKNNDPLDNRLSNIRIIPTSQNIQRAKGQNNKSGYKGVSPSGKKWRAYIKPHGSQINLGTYATKEQAAKVYDSHAKRYWGEFAYLNFPE